MGDVGDPSSQEIQSGGRNSSVWPSLQLFDVFSADKNLSKFVQSLELGDSNPVSATGEGKKQNIPAWRPLWGRSLVMSPGNSSGVQEGSVIHERVSLSQEMFL